MHDRLADELGKAAAKALTPMTLYCFATDLHGSVARFDKLLGWICGAAPEAVLLGGDVLPAMGSPGAAAFDDFAGDYLAPALAQLRQTMGASYPRVGVIMGNDDPRAYEERFRELEDRALWVQLHGKVVQWGDRCVAGYAFVPPTPFALKDWEKYDVSRYVDHGCTAPTEGRRSVEPDHDPRYATIAADLEALSGRLDLPHAIVLFHSPPYATVLDRASLDGVAIDGVAVDVHVGSIAIRRFIERHQPAITLHGHVHESAGLTGQFQQKLGRTTVLGAAHDGPELAIVSFDPADPGQAKRVLL